MRRGWPPDGRASNDAVGTAQHSRDSAADSPAAGIDASAGGLEPQGDSDLARILDIVRDALGVDFRHNRSNTLHRSITRRIALHGLDGLKQYGDYLETDRAEIKALFQDILAGATSCLLDPEIDEELHDRDVELTKTNDDLRNLIESVQAPIVMIGRDLRIRRFTPTAGTLLNLVPADVGRLVTDVELPIDARDLEEAIAQAVGSGERVERQVRELRGRRHSLRVGPYRTHEGRIDGAVLAFIDVDELRRAQSAVEESEERYRVLVEGARDFAIMMLDPGGHVASWNRGAQRIFGYEAPEILGAHFARFFTPEDVAANRPEKVLRTAESDDTAFTDHWFVRKDGSRFWGSGTTTALRDGAGPVRGYAKVIRDMSDRKALEDDLHRRLDELAAADRSKNEFLAMLAHELRNPLAPLTHAVRLLNDPATADGVRRQAQETTQRHVTHLARLVDDLLDVSRITQGKIRIRKGPVDAAASVREAAEDARPQIEARGQEIAVETPEAPVWLDADGVRLVQVFGNLLDNASKFSDDGARIELTAERTDGPRGSELVVRIRDHGIGIDAAMLPRVFDVFAQADNSVSRDQGGLGIGLTLVKSLVELHGGVVEAHSEGVGHGSEFVVRLPVPQDFSPTDVAFAERSGPAAPVHRRILIVDDNVDAATTLGLLLRAQGHDVQAVFSGHDCLEAVREFRPDVVILDLGMPGLDGIEVAKRLRRLEATSDVPLIALSGYGRAEDRRRTREAGFAHHLLKPVKLEVLQQVIERRSE